MNAAVRVKHQWWFEEVAGRAEAEHQAMKKLLDVIRADAIEFEVLLDPELRQRLSAAGLEQAKKFNWERTARQVLDVYQQASATRH